MINEYVVTEVLCDDDACGDSVDGMGATAREVRRDANRDGWRCDDSGDWCPQHASERVA